MNKSDRYLLLIGELASQDALVVEIELLRGIELYIGVPLVFNTFALTWRVGDLHQGSDT